MNREKEFEKVKKVIKNYYDLARCGIFNTRNIVGDNMTNIYKGKYFEVDICHSYEYFEVFGTTKEEFDYLENYYEHLKGQL